METRHSKGKFSELPLDYTKMVIDVFTNAYEKGLGALEKHTGKKPHLIVSGRIYTNEIVLAISLTLEKSIGATTVYASVDFDATASAPTAQDLLSLCVDAAGAVFQNLLHEPTRETLNALASSALSEIDNVPFQWTSIEIDKRTLYVKLDKAHIALDRMADEWLKKNDPELARQLAEDEEEAENQIIVGPKGHKH